MISARKITTYAKDIKALSDTPNKDGLSATQLKAYFMGAADEEIKTAVNGLCDDLTFLDAITEVTQVLGLSATKIPSEKAVTDAMIAAGLGDMLKVIYDSNNDGKVNSADDSDKLGGNLPAYFEPALPATPTDPTNKVLNGNREWAEVAVVGESATVNVSTDDSASVVGQVITMTDNTVSSLTETYTLLTGESSHTFKVLVGHSYTISVDAKSLYTAPSALTYTAIAGNTRTIAMQYLACKRYGFRRTKATTDPEDRIEYLYDAVGLTPAYMDFSSGNFNFGSWQAFTEEVSRPVMLKNDGTVDYALSRTDFTKKSDGTTASAVDSTAYAGNAMIEFGKYKWVYRYEDATYEYVIFSNAQYDANYKALAHTNELGTIKDYFYWGAFKGSNVSSKLRSIGTGAVMVSQTRNTEVSYATAIGSGYYTIYKSGWDFICDLLTLISKSDDCQTKFGTGRSKSTNTTAIACGTLKAQPMFKGYNDETSDVKVFGIEGFWGNVWEGMAGLVFNTKIKTKMVPPYNFDGAGYVDSGITPSGTSVGFISSAQVGEQGFIPKVASGSGTTYYCDGLWFNTAQVDYALVGGYWLYTLRDGCRSVSLADLASAVDASAGSRLSYLNPA